MVDGGIRALEVAPDLRRALLRGAIYTLPFPQLVDTAWLIALIVAICGLLGHPGTGLAVGGIFFAVAGLSLSVQWLRVRARVSHHWSLGALVSAEITEAGVLIARPTGSLELRRGTFASARTLGDVVVLQGRKRGGSVLTAAALLSSADIARLVQPPHLSEAARTLMVTRSIQRSMTRAYLRFPLTRPVIWVVIAIEVCVLAFLAYLETLGIPTPALWLAVFVLLVYPIRFVLGPRRIYPVGRTVAAEVTVDGLMLDVPLLPASCAVDRLTASEPMGSAVALRRRRRGWVLLPREIVDLDAVRELIATGGPPTPS